MRSLLALLALCGFVSPTLAQPRVVQQRNVSDPVPVVIDVHIQIIITVDVTPPPNPGPGPGPGPGPNPNPPPPPPPPPPTDPLVTALIKAAGQDSFTAVKMNQISAGFSDCQSITATATTAGDLQKQLKAVLTNDIQGGIPKNVYAVLAAELQPLNNLLPVTDPTRDISSVRSQLDALFGKLSLACKNAATQIK